MGHRLAGASGGGRFARLSIPRPATHRGNGSARGWRTGARDRSGHRTSLATDAGALLTPAAQSQGSDAHANGTASQKRECLAIGRELAERTHVRRRVVAPSSDDDRGPMSDVVPIGRSISLATSAAAAGVPLRYARRELRHYGVG